MNLDGLSCHELYLQEREAADRAHADALAEAAAAYQAIVAAGREQKSPKDQARADALAAYEAIMTAARERHAASLVVITAEYDRRRAQHEARK